MSSAPGRYIPDRSTNIDARDRRLQAGHAIGGDEHDRYGFASISDVQARRLAAIALDPGIDYSVFRDLDFAKMAKKKRTKGRKRKRRYDVAARDERNRALGRAGERLVLEHERTGLRRAGAGYDTQSFGPGCGDVRKTFAVVRPT